MTPEMRIGFVGCGLAAVTYFHDLQKYPDLHLAGITGRSQERISQFGSFHGVNTYPSLKAMLADPKIEMIVNLTDPRSHFEVTKACLDAGKHVYSEKPIAMEFSQVKFLVELANSKGLYLSSAPCKLLGETAQTAWQALRNREIGTVHLVYAQLDSGPDHMQQIWRTPCGAVQNYRDEFEVGCTLEHASYYVTWLTAFFGPAKTVSAFSACVWPNKQVLPEEPLHVTTPDFSVACITFESGVLARLTNSIVAPYDHSLQVIGETGVLTVEEGWNLDDPVYIENYSRLRLRMQRFRVTRQFPFLKQWLSPRRRIYPPVKKVSLRRRYSRQSNNFARGIDELARAIRQKSRSRLPIDYCMHVNEVVLAMQNPGPTPYQVTTTFAPLEPLDEATRREIP
jgi:predicted dehydrogenase